MLTLPITDTIDFRLPENRREAFIRWWAWSLRFGDCDPQVWLTRYLNERYEHNTEQRYWFAWLYGNTYHLPTAWVLLNEFPDFELVNLERLTNWNSTNYRRLRYQTDTKWSKGHLPAMFQSYKEWVLSKGDTQEEAFLLSSSKGGFTSVWNEVKNKFYKFGRYTTWFYLQHLDATVGLNLTPTSLMLSDYSGSKSHRNGLLYALGKDEWVDSRLLPKQYEYLESQAQGILEETKQRFPHPDTNLFTMETALCSFKKLFRKTRGRYLGYYLDRQSEEIAQLEKDGWQGINWNVLWQAREECLESPLLCNRYNIINKAKFSHFLDTGSLEKIEWLS